MPNFKIRRRRKQEQQPAPVNPPRSEPVEEKIDPNEEVLTESSEEMYIDQAMSDLKMSKVAKPDPVPQKPAPVVNRPQYPQQRRPQYQKRATPVYQNPKPASYRNPYTTQNRIHTQYTRKPTMQIQNPRSKTTRGGAKIRFGSHYGTGGEHLDTHTKSLMLYNHCFG